MQKRLRSLLLLLLFFSFGCGKERGINLDDKGVSNVVSEDNEETVALNPKLPIEKEAILQQEKQILENAPAASVNKFAFNVYGQLQKQENPVFSPLSISLALATVYAGAKSTTEQEIASTLGFSGNDQSFHNAFGQFASLLSVKSSSEGGVTLDIANANWLQKGLKLTKNFTSMLETAYALKTVELDFIKDNANARVIINKSISALTHGKIDQLIKETLSKDTRIVLTNAIYFNGAWSHPFDEANTEEGVFTLANNQQKNVPYLYQEQELSYSENDDKQVVLVPYQGHEYAMVVVLPKQGKEDAVNTSLNGDTFKSVVDGLKAYKVKFKLPKFTQRQTPNMKEVLFALGVKAAFDKDQADFSGITTEEKIFISDVIHEAVVEVTEKGTIAAAATAVVGAEATAVPEPQELPSAEFYAVRPFRFFLIHQPTKAILFMGRVDNP